MKMLKHILAFLALILVSLAPVYADEGYIPFFPDFLEPNGIGFRGPSSIRATNCWAEHLCSSDSIPAGSSYSRGSSYVLSSPVTLEYRKNYFFKKLIYTQVFADYGQTLTNKNIRKRLSSPDSNGSYTSWYGEGDINSEPFLIKFFTAEEKQIISSLSSEDGNQRIFDLETEFNFF